METNCATEQWLNMHDSPSPCLRACTTPLKEEKKRKKIEKRRMEADFSLRQGQMGCNGMGIWCESRRGLQNLFFFSPRPRLDAASRDHISTGASLSLSLSLSCLHELPSDHRRICIFKIPSLPSSLRFKCAGAACHHSCWHGTVLQDAF